jgi:hypothetical protein
MINFTHKPCCPDDEQAQEIANKIREKTEKEQNNQLEENRIGQSINAKSTSFRYR